MEKAVCRVPGIGRLPCHKADCAEIRSSAGADIRLASWQKTHTYRDPLLGRMTDVGALVWVEGTDPQNGNRMQPLQVIPNQFEPGPFCRFAQNSPPSGLGNFNRGI
jgi:hypothetical protein